VDARYLGAADPDAFQVPTVSTWARPRGSPPALPDRGAVGRAVSLKQCSRRARRHSRARQTDPSADRRRSARRPASRSLPRLPGGAGVWGRARGALRSLGAVATCAWCSGSGDGKGEAARSECVSRPSIVKQELA